MNTESHVINTESPVINSESSVINSELDNSKRDMLIEIKKLEKRIIELQAEKDLSVYKKSLEKKVAQLEAEKSSDFVLKQILGKMTSFESQINNLRESVQKLIEDKDTPEQNLLDKYKEGFMLLHKLDDYDKNGYNKISNNEELLKLPLKIYMAKENVKRIRQAILHRTNITEQN